MKFYTGLLLKAVLTTLPAIPISDGSKLKPFKEYSAVLMKLCLNSKIQDLAYCSGISVATVSHIILKWIYKSYG